MLGIGVVVLMVLFGVFSMVHELRRRGHGPRWREVVFAVLGALLTAALVIALTEGFERLPTSEEIDIVLPVIILLAVLTPLGYFVQWRWGDDIKRWLSGDDQP